MSVFPAILLLTLSFSKVFCQQQNNATNADLKNKVAAINRYVFEIDSAAKNFNMRFHLRQASENSPYYSVIYNSFKAPYDTTKIVENTQNLKNSYFRDGKKVYLSEISAAKGNYSTIRNYYFENNAVIYSFSQLIEEHILQIKCTFTGPRGHNNSFDLSITKDSVTCQGKSNFKTKNTLSAWNNLIASLSLADFDKIKTGPFLSYKDGADMSYRVITDKRTHVFVNAWWSEDPAIKKLSVFFEQINFLIPVPK